MEKCPSWLNYFTALVRPGSLALMVLLLVFGGLGFATVEFFSPGSGERAAKTFVGFFAAIDSNYYATIQIMFTAYVFGRSGEAVAKEFANASVEKVKEKSNGPN